LAVDLFRDYRINGRKTTDDVQTRWRLHIEPCFGSRVKSRLFCRLSFLRIVGSCPCWLRGRLAEGVARSELAPQAAVACVSVAVSSSMRR
jgi:hypothetical protein